MLSTRKAVLESANMLSRELTTGCTEGVLLEECEAVIYSETRASPAVCRCVCVHVRHDEGGRGDGPPGRGLGGLAVRSRAHVPRYVFFARQSPSPSRRMKREFGPKTRS